MSDRLPPPKLLQDARVYLSGPMDFVASRAAEQKLGWRNRVGEFLNEFGVTVFDPWFKPELHGLQEYGKEDETTAGARADWTFESGKAGAAKRSSCSERFWPAMHIDLRMVDTSDFVVAYCPTNIYSVGTPHEIILARQQRKPVLFVSPHITFSALTALRDHLTSTGDQTGLDMLARLQNEVPIKENPTAAPSLWYMPLIGSEHFFDGFGFAAYKQRFGWPDIPLDEHEKRHPPERPLLPFIEKLNDDLPKKWSRQRQDFVPNDDWLLWKLSEAEEKGGHHVQEARE
ncbi:MAG: hypothetical protein JWM57_2795 [Phycisphaerales bacterium]|nr:hypothetical protein [Phycisphaerales bacterium]